MNDPHKKTPRQRLRQRLTGGPLIVAPGIYDAFGALLVEQAGYEAAYLTGTGVAAALLGCPDVGILDLTMMAGHAHHVASCIDIPLICDADTCYGNAVNVKRTVEEFEAAGVAAIQIEDQVTPKRNGQLPGVRPVIDFAEAVGKIAAAVAARRDPDFLIIGRTDAADGLGIEEGIRRANAYVKAGADIAFVEMKSGPAMLDNLRRVTAAVAAPFVVNVDAGGALGDLTAGEIAALGVRIGIYPGLARGAAGFAIREALHALQRNGHTKESRARMLTSKEFNELLGLAEVDAWEKRFLR